MPHECQGVAPIVDDGEVVGEIALSGGRVTAGVAGRK